MSYLKQSSTREIMCFLAVAILPLLGQWFANLPYDWIQSGWSDVHEWVQVGDVKRRQVVGQIHSLTICTTVLMMVIYTVVGCIYAERIL